MAKKTLYFETREQVKQTDSRFKSRASTSDATGISEDRLGDIETGETTPRPDEIVTLSEAYHAPELYNHYCGKVCPIGEKYMPKLDANDLDLYRVTMQFHNAIKDVEFLEEKLFKIADDGIVSDDESESFEEILDSLDALAARTTALKLWAHKNFK